MFVNGSDPTTYMTNPIFSHYDVILPIAIELTIVSKVYYVYGLGLTLLLI